MDPKELFHKPESGSPGNADRVDLTTTLYGELRRLAISMMARQNNPQTLQATALLHEAWIRLGGQDRNDWNSRKHYYSAVAEAMRHILVDRARRRQCKRHGGGMKRISMELWNWEQLSPDACTFQDRAILAVDEALEKLLVEDPEVADLVKFRYFVGLSVKETADLLDVSLRTVERRLAYARSWMGQEIQESLSA